MSGLTRNLPAQFGMKQDPNSRLYVPAGGSYSALFLASPVRNDNIDAAGVWSDVADCNESANLDWDVYSSGRIFRDGIGTWVSGDLHLSMAGTCVLDTPTTTAELQLLIQWKDSGLSLTNVWSTTQILTGSGAQPFDLSVSTSVTDCRQIQWWLQRTGGVSGIDDIVASGSVAALCNVD